MRNFLLPFLFASWSLSAQDFSRYPILEPGVQAHYLSSFDRSGGNDGFDGTYSALYVDEDGRHVIFDEKETMLFSTRPVAACMWDR